MRRFSLALGDGQLAGLNFGPEAGPIGLVFLHATGFNALTYRQLLAPLAERIRVVAIDLRGHGLSSLPAHPGRLTHWRGYADDLIRALAQLNAGLPPPGLIAGHSMGGTVGLLALAREPALARGLLLIDPALVPRPWRRWLRLPFAPLMLRRRLPIARAAGRRRAVFGSAEEVLQSYQGRGAFKTWQPGFLADYIEDGFAPLPSGGVRLRYAPAWEAATFAGHRHDTEAALRALRVPVHLMMAGRGSTIGRELPVLRANAPALSVEAMPECTHFIPMEAPQQVRDRILAMLGA